MHEGVDFFERMEANREPVTAIGPHRAFSTLGARLGTGGAAVGAVGVPDANSGSGGSGGR